MVPTSRFIGASRRRPFGCRFPLGVIPQAGWTDTSW